MTLQPGRERYIILGEVLWLHVRDGIVDPATLRVAPDLCADRPPVRRRLRAHPRPLRAATPDLRGMAEAGQALALDWAEGRPSRASCCTVRYRLFVRLASIPANSLMRLVLRAAARFVLTAWRVAMNPRHSYVLRNRPLRVTVSTYPPSLCQGEAAEMTGESDPSPQSTPLWIISRVPRVGSQDRMPADRWRRGTGWQPRDPAAGHPQVRAWQLALWTLLGRAASGPKAERSRKGARNGAMPRSLTS